MKSYGKHSRTIEQETNGIKELLDYVNVDIDTGIITWSRLRPKAHNIKIGDVAGTNVNGYTHIWFNNSVYRRHRIVFYVAHGYLPLIVDHVHGKANGDGIANIREATQAQNAVNKKRRNNATGYTGVSYKPSRNRYEAYISIDGKQKYIGSAKTAEQASRIYEAKAKELHGEFYRGGNE